MSSTLKNHPFAVDAFFESSLVLTFAVPKEDIRHLLPECLEPDTFMDKWAFVAVAMVQTKDLRPKGFPRFMGNDFFLAGYRLFVKYHTNQGKRLRGLYILKSETDKKKMAFRGNIFTHYNYSVIDVNINRMGNEISVFSEKSGLDVKVIKKENALLPVGSPFSEWKEARRFAGPLPFTFTYNKSSREVTIIEGVRQNWTPEPVEIIRSKIGFLDDESFSNAISANAFIVESIPYHWKKGVTEIWKA